MGSRFPHEAMRKWVLDIPHEGMLMCVTSFIFWSTSENFFDQSFLFERKKGQRSLVGLYLLFSASQWDSVLYVILGASSIFTRNALYQLQPSLGSCNWTHNVSICSWMLQSIVVSQDIPFILLWTEAEVKNTQFEEGCAWEPSCEIFWN